jgi:putative transposase
MAKGRQHTVDQKVKVLEEARQPGTTVAEVLRRHQLDAATFYRWEKQAKEAVREAFSERGRRREADAKDREIEQLRAEVVRKSRVIAEVTEENLELKKSSEPWETDAVLGRGEGGRVGAG